MFSKLCELEIKYNYSFAHHIAVYEIFCNRDMNQIIWCTQLKEMDSVINLTSGKVSMNIYKVSESRKCDEKYKFSLL